jgi:hypothetical protein
MYGPRPIRGQGEIWQRLQSTLKVTSWRTLAPRPAPTNRNRFPARKSWAKLTAEWPASRLVQTWNSFASVAPFDDLRPLKKFTDRKAAIARIWKAVQRLSPDVAPLATPVATERTRSRKSPAKASRSARAQKGETESRTNKKAEVIALMKRAKGATLDEIMEATGWQKHTIRGFVSILAGKGSSKNAGGERTYRIATPVTRRN